MLYFQIYYHKLGTLQAEDILVYKDPEHPEYLHYMGMSDDGRYVLLEITRSTERVNKLWITDLQKTGGKITGMSIKNLPLIILD